MRKRNISIPFRLSNEEADKLNQLVEKSGLTREAYLRHLINGVVPRDKPPPDYYKMMREIYRVGNNLNQVAQKAHSLNVIDVQRFDKINRQLDELVIGITKAVILPEKK